MRFATPSNTQRATLLLVVATLFHASNYSTSAFVPLKNVQQANTNIIRPLVKPASRSSAFVNCNTNKLNNNQPWNFRKDLPPSAAALTSLSTAASSTASASTPKPMSKFMKTITKIGMVAYITTVALGFMMSLSIIKLLGYAGVPEVKRQKWALSTGQFVARWALRIFPFCKLDVIAPPEDDEGRCNPEPAIWVCNHTSMLDIFLLLASDRKMRGRKKRPIKVVYWKDLEDNPFCKILFRQSGFIPIEMTANKPGEANNYNPSSFKKFLKESKKAFADGFDIGILPEGQLNPNPEKGLLPIFSGAYTLARMSRRPIQMMALHGVNQLWHPNDGFEVGDMNVTGRDVKLRVYPGARKYESEEDFRDAFTNVVGHFGKYGTDVKDANQWLDGTKWAEKEEKRKAEEKAAAEEKRRSEELEAKRKAEEEKLKAEADESTEA